MKKRNPVIGVPGFGTPLPGLAGVPMILGVPGGSNNGAIAQGASPSPLGRKPLQFVTRVSMADNVMGVPATRAGLSASVKLLEYLILSRRFF
ncbi:hypothetical protein CH379_012440 [Leptospira ellisii]|uniref:Uncharacterized protein n=1 Tax=Leptospira ellisii TaxID=2023197 RepID=A0AAE4U0Q1_9LEPT|nr:hypothetical protein [Leptospira ellisii]MDV6236436.1 hypothetical protein [Leptospira ellisii]